MIQPEEVAPPAKSNSKRKSNSKKSQLPQLTAATPKSTSTTKLETVNEAVTPKDRTPIKPAGEEMHPEHHHRSTAKPMTLPKLPQPAAAATPTPKKQMIPKPAVPVQSASTPKDRTPIKPAGAEMHPALHHPSTAKPLDEARWLGFQALGAHTAPPKGAEGLGVGEATPSKAKIAVPDATPKKSFFSSPDFSFKFRAVGSTMTPNTARILKENEEKEGAAEKSGLFGRKKAVPKAKAPRFSDAHMAAFKKMDSIANHPSAFRADPNRFKAADKQEPAKKGPNKLKRKQSKMDVKDTTMQPPVSKLVATPLKRTHSKMDTAPASASTLPHPTSTVRLVPPSRDGRPGTSGEAAPAKRVRRTKEDDAASTRPALNDVSSDTVPAATPARSTARSRFASRLMTPTKASLLRSQSVKAAKTTSMLPDVFRSPTAKAILSPTNIGESMKEGFRKTSDSLQKVRSILRTPARKFSDDPEKVAAGTHMSPPPMMNLAEVLPKPPATAPVRKRVNFSDSTLERCVGDDVELGKSPSPVKMRAGSVVPAGAVVYPKLGSGAGVVYPTLPENVQETEANTPSRRLTFGGEDGMRLPDFSFESNKPIKFGNGSSAKGTIRMVRKSDASALSLAEGKKRKLDSVEETSDKENNGPVHEEDEGRSPAKKARTVTAEPAKTPAKTEKSRLPRRTPKSGSSISMSRLAFLATPKRSRR